MLGSTRRRPLAAGRLFLAVTPKLTSDWGAWEFPQGPASPPWEAPCGPAPGGDATIWENPTKQRRDIGGRPSRPAGLQVSHLGPAAADSQHFHRVVEVQGEDDVGVRIGLVPQVETADIDMKGRHRLILQIRTVTEKSTGYPADSRPLHQFHPGPARVRPLQDFHLFALINRE